LEPPATINQSDLFLHRFPSARAFVASIHFKQRSGKGLEIREFLT
jgi:hypothetical protein